MIKNFLDADEEQIEPKTTSVDSSIFGGLNTEPVVKPRADEHHDPFAASDFHIEPTPEPQPKPVNQNASFPYTPPTAAESSRMSGLAFTAGVAFVSSVVFMLMLGWLADTFLGTGPWGIVSGIVLGSIIGFIQFFRLNSQILKNSQPSQPTSFLDLGEKKPSDVTSEDNPPNAEARTE